MNRRIVAGVAYRVGACVAAIIVLELVLGREGLLSGFLYLNLSPLLRPLQYSCALLFASSILRLVLAGGLVAPLVSSVKMLAFGLFLYMLFSQHPMLAEFSPFGFWAFACSAVAAFERTVGAILSSYHIDHLKPFLTCISLFLVGYFSSTMLHAFSRYITFGLQYMEQLKTNRTFNFRYIFFVSLGYFIFASLASIDTIILYSSVFVSALSLLGMLSHSRNPYSSYFGGVFAKASNISVLFVLVTMIQIYFFNLRPILLDVFPWHISSLEWVAVCITTLAVFMRVKSYVSRALSEQLRLGEWEMHIQKIVHNKGDLEEASKAISRFVEEGVKEGVIVYLTSILLRNGVSFPDIERVIGGIAGYEDIPPPRLALALTLAFNLESLRERNRNRRMEVLTSALREAVNILHLPTPLISIGGEPGENREV